MIFRDRHDAGKRLALTLLEYEKDPKAIVIALPRGGVVVGYEIAQALDLPLDIVSPRKIGAPGNPELAIGAITETGEGIFSESLIKELGVPQEYLKKVVEEEKKEALRRLNDYRQNQPPRNLKNKKVLLVDDGLATGSTMRAAIKTVKAEHAQQIIVAIPVAPPDTLMRIRSEVNKVICIASPPLFYAVGQFYDYFDQTSDEEVKMLLATHFKRYSK